MPLPRFRNHEIGLTGRFRFRRQHLSALSVLQVEVEIIRSRYPIDSPSDEVKYTAIWRDATYEEAVQIQINYGG